MAILIVYLSLKGLVSLFAFIQSCYYFVISLGVSFFGHYNWKQPLGDFLQNSCSTSVLNQLKYACENVRFSLKLQLY